MSPRAAFGIGWLLGLCVLSCVTSSPVGAADPVSAIVLAGAVGAVRVQQGDCFTVCPVGTTCNQKTGMCDTLPCHGQCRPEERCDEAGLIPHCVADSSRIFLSSNADGGFPGT
ncbi:MAG: hypothetical protein ACJ790_10950, partial [Myxococcaceae bacterium]